MRQFLAVAAIMLLSLNLYCQINNYTIYSELSKDVKFEPETIDLNSQEFSTLISTDRRGTKFYNTTDGSILAVHGNSSFKKPPQAFTPIISAFVAGSGYPNSSIVDTENRYLDICSGDSILFIATGSYPNSLESIGTGYSQNDENMTYLWRFSDNTILNGDSVWFRPDAISGYIVDLIMTDTTNYSEGADCKIRISAGPVITTAIEQSDDICSELPVQLTVGIEDSHFSGESTSTNANFQQGGIVAGETFLPDGTGEVYTTSIYISGFNTDDTLETVADLSMITAEIEHSFLGDLEIWVECPDGTTAEIVNSYSGGALPGGFGGGVTHLGTPIDDDNDLTAGEGWVYSWSSDPALYTLGSFATEHGNGNFITNGIGSNAMDSAGVYQPDQDFSQLIGCPLNGNWTIYIQDNIGSDNGYIFEWSIDFDTRFYDDIEEYEVGIVEYSFISTGSETTVLGKNDYVFQTEGEHPFLVTVIDEFGCVRDTTIEIISEDCSIEATNVMTINNDGQNDNFIVEGVEFWPNTMVKVFNRFGNLVYESDSYNNDWDGSLNDSGRMISSGTYYYLVQRTIDEEAQSGFITVIRDK